MTSDAELSTDDLARPAGRGDAGPPVADEPTSDHRTDLVGSADPGAMQDRDAGAWDAGTAEAGAAGGRAPGADTGQVAAGGQNPDEPVAGPREMTPRPGAGGPADVALLDPADAGGFRHRWSDVQARFVDDPQDAVRTADGLVAELMQSLAQGFSEHKGRLESAWQSGGTPDTEELRQALQRYRSFFNRLLAT
jgi:hypothetical protein